MKEIKRVFIAGGTGLLGYHSALLLRKHGIEVDTIALENEIETVSWFPKDISLSFGNLFEMSGEQIEKLLKKKKYDGFVYALGPDDRVSPNAPAYEFFYEKLVVECKKICNAAKNAGIKCCVVLNSYFSYFDKKLNGKLSKSHPYIKARIKQQEELFSIGDESFKVMMLELPYIFGTMPNRKPLWKESFLSHFDGMKSVMFPKGGGTSVITVEDVAMAVAACLINGENGKAYPIGNVNMEYKDLIKAMMNFLGDNRKYKQMPASLCALGGIYLNHQNKKLGKESGLNYAKLMTQIQNKKFYIDPAETQNALGYKDLNFCSSEDVLDKIKESMQAC